MRRMYYAYYLGFWQKSKAKYTRYNTPATKEYIRPDCTRCQHDGAYFTNNSIECPIDCSCKRSAFGSCAIDMRSDGAIVAISEQYSHGHGPQERAKNTAYAVKRVCHP
ncbi:hypothetical protein MBANPS3_006062 [Mucor bainieri]